MVAGQGEMVQAYKNLLKKKKEWDRLYPDEKSDPVHQQKYQASIDAFYKLAQMKIENMVKEYSGKAGMHGEVATGSIEKMTNLLFTDFVNGLNQEVSLEQMKKLEDEAKQASILETADEYLYGLFSQSIDAVMDKMVSEDDKKREAEDSRWNIKFDSTSDDGSIIVSRAQVIPPFDATFEEQNTTYKLAIVDKGSQMEMSGAGAAWKMTKIRIRFKGTNVKGKLIIQKDFTYEPELKGTFTEREYWDAEKKKLKKEYTYYWRSDGKEKIRDGKIRQWFENGTPELEGNYKDNAMDGILKRYWANGQPYDSTTYNKGTKEGLYQYWNFNGQLEIYGNFKLNRKVGAWVYPDAEGSYLDRFETVVKTYHSDRAIPQDDSKDGLYYEVGTRVGKWIFYSHEIENNRKYKSKEESYNDKGNRHGLSIEYYSNGQKSSECNYVDDEAENCHSYNEDGSEKK